MSYKHNNLMAMRQQYWRDLSARTQQEKYYMQQLLQHYQVYKTPSLLDVQHLFFHLPSLIIVKGYALGFCHPDVLDMMCAFIEDNRVALAQKADLKIQFR
jgi:1,4-dihydroxy-2-naphthoyl-CoA synthase